MSLTKKGLQYRELSISGYEKVIEIKCENSKLHAIIALHNTTLGPALGGIRVYPYATFEQALTDALRLSEGMTHKAALAQTGTGGGKSVIIHDPLKGKPEALLEAFGEAIESLNGLYIGAEDVGMGVQDLDVIRRKTTHLVGMNHPKSSGDPSPYTSRGAFKCIQAVCKKIWKDSSPRDKTVAIQGLGSVGMKLARMLFWEGAKLIVTDVDQKRVEQAVSEFGASGVRPEEIYGVKCDIFSPCAMGGILNPQTIPQLKCVAVAGLANNQLLTAADGESLHQRKILYAPDFAINAGGLINVCAELEEGGYSPSTARDQVDRLYDLLLFLFTLAEERGESTTRVVKQIVEDNLKKGLSKRTKAVSYPHSM